MSKQVWNSPAANYLKQITGKRSTKAALKRKIGVLLDGHERKFSLSVEELAGLVGAEVRFAEMEGLGKLEPKEGGFTIYINKNDPPARQRFTCAHEVIHTFFFKKTSDKPSLSTEVERNSRNLEKLCDKGAAYLLLPKQLCIEKYEEYLKNHPGRRLPEVLVDLARKFEVSVQTLSSRLSEFRLVDSTLVLWRYMHKLSPDSQKKLRVGWMFNHYSCDYYIPKYKKAPEGSDVMKVWKGKKKIGEDKAGNIFDKMTKDEKKNKDLKIISCPYGRSQVFSAIPLSGRTQ